METMREVFLALSTERCNCELMFTNTDDVGFIVTCRLRPWKSGMNSGRMILSGGRTPHEAIVYAYWGLINGKWIPLDWRARAVRNGCVETPIEPRLEHSDVRMSSVSPQEVAKLVDQYFHTGGAPIEPLDPIVSPQNGAEPATVTPPKRK